MAMQNIFRLPEILFYGQKMHQFPLNTLNTLIAQGSDDFIEIHKIVDENAALIAELSGTYKTQPEKRYC